MYLVFTRMPGESYHRQLRSLLLYLCDVFRTCVGSAWALWASFRFRLQGGLLRMAGDLEHYSVCVYIYIYMFSSMLLPTTVCWDVPNINLCNQFSTLSPVSCSLYSIFSNSHSWLCQFSLLLIYLCRKISLFSCRKQVVTVQHCPIFIVVGF